MDTDRGKRYPSAKSMYVQYFVVSALPANEDAAVRGNSIWLTRAIYQVLSCNESFQVRLWTN